MLIAFIMPFISQAQVKNFDSYPVYTGIDLGLLYTSQQCVFRIWAPTAEKAELLCIMREQAEQQYKRSTCKKVNWDHGSHC